MGRCKHDSRWGVCGKALTSLHPANSFCSLAFLRRPKRVKSCLVILGGPAQLRGLCCRLVVPLSRDLPSGMLSAVLFCLNKDWVLMGEYIMLLYWLFVITSWLLFFISILL